MASFKAYLVTIFKTLHFSLDLYNIVSSMYYILCSELCSFLTYKEPSTYVSDQWKTYSNFTQARGLRLYTDTSHSAYDATLTKLYEVKIDGFLNQNFM